MESDHNIIYNFNNTFPVRFKNPWTDKQCQEVVFKTLSFNSLWSKITLEKSMDYGRPMKPFFHRNPKLLGFCRQIGQMNSEAFGVLFLKGLLLWVMQKERYSSQINQNFGTICLTEVCLTFSRLAAKRLEVSKKISRSQPQNSTSMASKTALPNILKVFIWDWDLNLGHTELESLAIVWP